MPRERWSAGRGGRLAAAACRLALGASGAVVQGLLSVVAPRLTLSACDVVTSVGGPLVLNTFELRVGRGSTVKSKAFSACITKTDEQLVAHMDCVYCMLAVCSSCAFMLVLLTLV